MEPAKTFSLGTQIIEKILTQYIILLYLYIIHVNI